MSEWDHWQDNEAYKYAIRMGGRLYPVKQVVSLATGTPVSEFSGGEGYGQANAYVRDLGFEIVPLRSRNPKWTRDELILALDFYLQHRPNPPAKDSDDVGELSRTLNRLAISLSVPHDAAYRNPNAVYMKLMNFRRFDPEYTSAGRIGLIRGGKGEELVWAQFAADPVRCRDAAQAIREGIAQTQSSPLAAPEERGIQLAPPMSICSGERLAVTSRRRAGLPPRLGPVSRLVPG